MPKIQTEIEGIEGFQIENDEMILKVWQWGTEIGAAYHYGSYIDITRSLINELAKYDLDLESFLVSESINYKLIKPKNIIKTYKPALGLHFHIKWDAWHCPNSGTINGHYFCHHYNDLHGNYIKLVFNNQIYHNPSLAATPDYVKPYFDYIWQQLEETKYIRFPREISLGSKVANHLPDGFRAYKTGDDSQCKVARSKEKYCYIKRFRDYEWYISPTDNYQLMAKKADSIKGAISEALKMITEMISNPNHPWNN